MNKYFINVCNVRVACFVACGGIQNVKCILTKPYHTDTNTVLSRFSFLIPLFVSLFIIQTSFVHSHDLIFSLFTFVICPQRYVQIAEHAIEEYIDSVTAT